MKIDFICSSLGKGGAQRVMVLLANYFVTKGHQVSIITLNDGDAFPVDDKVLRVRLHSGPSFNHTFRSLFNLITYYKARRNRPDVCISFIRKMSFSAIIAAKLFSIKVIASEHSNHKRKFSFVGNFTWSFLYRFADYVTVLTDYDRSFFVKKRAKVAVMPNPVSFIAYKNALLVKREKVILAAGNLNRYKIKGFDNLLKLIKPVLKENESWILKIIGAGDEGLAFLKDLALQLEISDKVIFDGFRSDVDEVMRNSEIFVLSSRFEGLPMVLLEAMSQGMVCISYDCITGPSEIINHERNGLLIENQNSSKMKDGLVRLINDFELRESLRVSGLNSLDKYSLENVYQLWLRLLKEITGKDD